MPRNAYDYFPQKAIRKDMFEGECELMSAPFTIRQSSEDLNGQAMGLLLVFQVACVNVGQRERRTVFQAFG